MPPKRRSAGATAKSTQSTLAFHGASNKVTKPGTRAANAKKNLIEGRTSDVEKPAAPAEIQVEDEDELELELEPTTAEAAIIEQTEQAQEPAQSTPEEDEARKIKTRQLQAFWKKQTGNAPRYHQEDLSLEEKILRKFDMTAQYGPCTGIPRIKRWKRAHRLGLEPPIEVLAVLLQEQEKHDKISVQRSILDELLNSRTEIDV